MTEDEAKTKWCPAKLADAKVRVDVYLDRDQDGRCIGSRCMAWRWAIVDKITGEIWQADSPKQVDTIRKHNTDAELGGFCGLAGKP